MSRAYTYAEIQNMRGALRSSYPCGRPYYENERSAEIEARLQTIIAGSVDPQDVIDSCLKEAAAQQAFYFSKYSATAAEKP